MWKRSVFSKEVERWSKYTGDMAQWIGCLIGKHDILSSSPSTARTRCGGAHMLSQHWDGGGKKTPGDSSGEDKAFKVTIRSQRLKDLHGPRAVRL